MAVDIPWLFSGFDGVNGLTLGEEGSPFMQEMDRWVQGGAFQGIYSWMEIGWMCWYGAKAAAAAEHA